MVDGRGRHAVCRHLSEGRHLAEGRFPLVVAEVPHLLRPGRRPRSAVGRVRRAGRWTVRHLQPGHVSTSVTTHIGTIANLLQQIIFNHAPN